MSDKPEVHNHYNNGCLDVFILVTLIWVLLTGITINGTHYELGCSGIADLAPEVRVEHE